MPMFREPCSPLHQGEEQLDIELFLRFFYITLFVGMMKGKKKIVDGGGEEVGQFLTGRNGFPYFIYVVAIISI